MTRFVPLSRQRHADLLVRKSLAADNLRYVRLGYSELTVAVSEFCVCLAKEEDTGKFNLIALVSLHEPRNLFWIEGAWNAIYVPKGITHAPFLLDASSPYGLAIDEDSQLIADDGLALFTPGGEPSDRVNAAYELLRDFVEDVAQGQAVIDRLSSLGLIRPFGLQVVHGAETSEIDGLYTVSPDAMAALDEATIVALYRDGCIAAASLMLASINQLERLRRLTYVAGGEFVDAVHVLER